jgi:MFS family permease
MMLVARIALGGIAAAMIMPVTLSVITSTFPEEQRARAVGIWAGVAGGGGILGLFFSSFIVDYFTWPWLFTLPIALAVTSFVMTWRYVTAGRELLDGRSTSAARCSRCSPSAAWCSASTRAPRRAGVTGSRSVGWRSV